MATNILGIGIGIANAIGFNKFKMGGIASIKPIASYRCYDKTNDDADRDVLTDLTGNGHDIQLYNFAFAEGSGYGKYGINFNNWIKGEFTTGEIIVLPNKFTIASQSNSPSYILYTTTKRVPTDIPSTKVKVTGLNNSRWNYAYIDETGELQLYSIIEGENILPKSHNSKYIGETSKTIGFYNIPGSYFPNEQELIVEQIPDYQGALVSDGVGDYGLCENFPILTKEKGYTVCAIRKWLDYSNGALVAKVFLSKRVHDSNLDNPTQHGAFTLDKIGNINNANYSVINYGNSNKTNDLKFITNTFTYLTSGKWNNTNISAGKYIDNYSYLNLFFGYISATSGYPISEYSSIALYALEIYDRDLTDEEIAKVKARMIAEYEEKTGNKYEEETT